VSVLQSSRLHAFLYTALSYEEACVPGLRYTFDGHGIPNYSHSFPGLGLRFNDLTLRTER
jgi:hypothetical protein